MISDQLLVIMILRPRRLDIRSYKWKENIEVVNFSQVSLSGKVSSQYLSAILMAAPLALGDVEIVMADKLVSVPYVDMTLRLMERFGVTVDRHGGWERFSIKGGQTYKYGS